MRDKLRHKFADQRRLLLVEREKQLELDRECADRQTRIEVEAVKVFGPDDRFVDRLPENDSFHDFEEWWFEKTALMSQLCKTNLAVEECQEVVRKRKVQA